MPKHKLADEQPSPGPGLLRIAPPGRLFSLAAGPLKSVLSLPEFQNLYRGLEGSDAGASLPARILERLDIRFTLDENDRSRIPSTGGAVIVANHPSGLLETLILAAFLLEIRHDVKFLANSWLEQIPEARDLIIGVDPFGGPSATGKNIRPIKEALRHLKRGGVLCIFPAGEVAHLHWKNGRITEPEWNPSVARLILRAEVPVLPVFFEASNSPSFQLLGLAHPMFRTALLLREFLEKRGGSYRAKIGNLISSSRMGAFPSSEDLITHLRIRTFFLQNRGEEEPSARFGFGSSRRIVRLEAPLAPPRDPLLIEKEITGLPSKHILTEAGEFVVIRAKAYDIPLALEEIGRLRELTFREVAEGTGKALDLDEFDSYYHHLFLWHKERKEIAGAYRIGKTDRILRHLGKKGLYCSTLFRFKRGFWDAISPALELGRSWVKKEYQKNFLPLFLLWKGISRFIAREPRYRYLIGPVSISASYKAVSRQLIVDCLRQCASDQRLSRMVKARTPHKELVVTAGNLPLPGHVLKDRETVSALLGDIEGSPRRIPILLQQYLTLGGKVLGFNVDPAFNNALDALLFVDLPRAGKPLLGKFMGKGDVEAYLGLHERN